VGEIVASQFDDWDLIDIPPAPMLSRLGIQSIEMTVRQCRQDLKHITSFVTDGMPAGTRGSDSVAAPLNGEPLAYKRVHSESVDFIPHLLAATGRTIVSVADEIPDEEDVVVNTLGAAVHQVVKYLRRPRTNDTVIISDAENASRLKDLGRVMVLPCSYGQLCQLLAAPPAKPPLAAPTAAQMPAFVEAHA
jgi:hypothetical protein